MRLLLLSTITLSGLTLSTAAQAQYFNAHEACKSTENRQQLIGGGIGAIAGGVIGSQLAANGARTEGSALGAVIGGLAGAGIADKRIDCDPVYPSRSVQTSNHGHAYQGSSTYHASSYAPSNTVHYQDRVTYSDHPVYSNPGYTTQTYQAPVQRPQHYSASTTSYRVVQQPAVQQVRYTNTTYQPTTYRQAAPAPRRVYATHSINNVPYSGSVPLSQARQQTVSSTYRTGTHYHGKYSCTAPH